AILFAPGTYGSATDPLVFQVGYYTEVAGLGLTPNAVTVNGVIDVLNQCSTGHCIALDNFWRSLSNLTLNVTLPSSTPVYSPPSGENAGCLNTNDFWAVSQASPVRRVVVNGSLFLFDYCGDQNYSSGGFIADSKLGPVVNGTQQQFLVRNSSIGSWSNSVWNQVFSGVQGAPAPVFSGNGNQVTDLATSPVTREEPFLYMDGSGNFKVFVPAVQRDSSGPSWSSGGKHGSSIPLSRFFVATPSDSGAAITAALSTGKDLILTPGIYHVEQTIDVPYADTVVLGLGFPTLIPEGGNVAMQVEATRGVELSGLLFDAGPVNSPALLQVGAASGTDQPNDPSAVQDVFFRIGGAEPGRAATSLVVDSSDAILDDVWAWRADHGSGVGWTANVGATGVVVNGGDVTAYGLFVEHYQKTEVVWNGQGGTDIFFQNELPYDPPNQAAWMATPTQNGYPAFEVSPTVRSFRGYGMCSYVVFIQTTATIFDAEAYEAPTSPGVQFHDICTVWIAGSGGDQSIIDGTGGPDTSTDPGQVEPVDVAGYP
ncbi:MAG: adenylyl cyclase, partial [Candidatus Dormibacteraeota bacterium]|nr:adenylyl cyclase [Candidatus Dormibacteraeota bacterium]